MSTTERLQEVEYHGDQDVTVWIDDLNGEDDPKIFPLWPADYPAHLAVCMEQDGSLHIARSRQTMLAARHIDRLWFCNIPEAPFLAETTDIGPGGP